MSIGFHKFRHKAILNNITADEVEELLEKIKSFDYKQEDFHINILGARKYFLPKDKKANFALHMYNEEMIKDQRIKGLLLEYLI